MFRKLIPVFLVLMLVLTACDLHVTVPVSTVEPVITDEIVIPLPAASSQPTLLKLSFGAGTLKLSPGATGLVDGTAVYNVLDFKPVVTVEDHSVLIEQGDYRLDGIPDFSNIENRWDLQLGAVPLDLEIEGGAYDAEFDLGGLSLVNLTIQEGASRTLLTFDQPNPVEMNLLRYETGASSVEITGLANANFTTMEFSGGAGSYTLDFSGDLQRSASIHIQAGVSNLTLEIPEGIPVQLTLQDALASVNPVSGWTQNGAVFTQAGSGPQLVIVVEIGAGNLTLTR